MDLKRPILFANITIELNTRGKKWDLPQVVKKQVVAGTNQQIKVDNDIKRRMIYHLKGKKASFTFDLDKIRIIKIEKIQELGLGYMNNKNR